MRTLLVLSQASVNLPHRKPYDRLGRRGWNVHIATPASLPLGDGRVNPCDPVPDGAAYVQHIVTGVGLNSQRLCWYAGLTALALRLRPDAILVEHDPGSLLVLEAYLASRACGASVLAFTPENIEQHRFLDALDDLRRGDVRATVRDLGVGILGALGKRAMDGLACLNEEGRRLFEPKLPGKPVVVMPLGTDTSLFRPMDVRALRTSLGLDGRFVLGYFGRLVPEKGVALVIEALAELPADVVLLLDMFKNFLPGSFAASLMDRATELGVRDRIVTFDAPHDEVARYMNCADAMVLPSRTLPRWKEQFGRVIPEAMACGVPVIGTDSGNIPDAVGDAGLIVPEGSSKAIAEAALRLRDDRELHARLVERGHRRVESILSIDHQVEVLEALVERAARR